MFRITWISFLFHCQWPVVPYLHSLPTLATPSSIDMARPVLSILYWLLAKPSKSFLAVLFPVLFIYGIILQNYQSSNYDEDFHYEDYVSNWNELQCCIWAFIHCYLVLVQSKSTFYRVIRQVGIGMNFSCLTSSLAIAITYWGLLPPERHEYNINALHQHGFLFLITTVDFILSTARIRNWFRNFSGASIKWTVMDETGLSFSKDRPVLCDSLLWTRLSFEKLVKMVLYCLRLDFCWFLCILCLYYFCRLW